MPGLTDEAMVYKATILDQIDLLDKNLNKY